MDAINGWQREGQKVVFTNGVFDILHAGHVMYLKEAKALGGRLVVGLNSDKSARALGKGPERPINPEEDRQAVLEGLRSVDLVIVFGEDTPAELIELIQPDILVKGGDYDPECTDSSSPLFIVGSTEVKSRGGTVHSIPLLPGRSTTSIIKKSRT